MEDVAALVIHARDLHRQSRWAEACDEFLRADHLEPLGVDDLELLAESAQILGRGDDAVRALERVYQARVGAGELDAAVTAGFWLWQASVLDGEFARAGGWAARVRQMVAEHPDAEDQGWLLITQAYGQVAAGEYEDAVGLARRAAELGARQGVVDLFAFATTICGRALLKAGRLEEGLGRMDEGMLSVTEGATSPRVTSMLYCSAIATCHEALELGRVREWGRSLDGWLNTLPPLHGAYFGNCRIYRSLLLRLQGSWQAAVEELADVCIDLAEGYGRRVVGHAYYHLGEMHRLLGDAAEAEDAYRRASEYGEPIQPGLALLRLAQGEVGTAVTGMRRALAEAQSDLDRCRLLPDLVTALLAAGEVDEAKRALDELVMVADRFPTAAMRAELASARAAVALAEGHAADALPLLRAAATTWREIDAPYETATVSVLIAAACRDLADEEAAVFELRSAAEVFARLGALPDLRRVEHLLAPGDGAHGLSAREMEVLRLVANGKTNHAIAAELFLSERTVDRHVSNIFDKLGVRSRTAAATYAIEHHLFVTGIL
ncbi:helix-turn-helix transcriptional regulator [Agromyces sp. ISL-38]|uniref:helix-turn-helix transcriptional regulator n=1 Tax=Agromyces sp. ISL-38 TaxID=2819107 RepID=UPI0020357FC9|nr:helix-turn-helix transcriptional regulator [Agromyces sp. ISL-38]